MKLKRRIFSARHQQAHIGYVAKALGLYFFLLPLDALELGRMGSILRIFSVLVVGLALLNAKSCRIRFNPLSVSLILLLLCHFFSLCYTISWNRSLVMFKTMLLNIALVFVTGAMYPFHAGEARFFKNCMVLSSLLTILLTAFNSRFVYGRLTLSFGSSSQDVNYLNGYLLFAEAFFFDKVMKKARPAYILPIILIFLFSMMTGSRGALIALIVVGLAVVLFNIHFSARHKKRLILTTLALLILALVSYDWLLSLLPREIAMRFNLGYISDHGTTGRFEIWKNLLDTFQSASPFRQLFGFGSGTILSLNTYSRRVAHNIWVEQLLTLGLVGLAVMIYMQIVFLREAIRSRNILFLSVFIGYLVMGMSLSIISYKPMWNCMIMILLLKSFRKKPL